MNGICRSPRRRGFTLIELVIVMVILSLTAVMVIPKGFFSFEPPMRQLQQTVMELCDLALDGFSVRMRFEPVDRADSGRIVIEGLVKTEDRFDEKKYSLEWKPIQIRYPLTGDRWKLEPEIVYFYTDGTCTPARILRADRDARITEGDSALLTVTGFLFEEQDERS